jgi:hypothetical protein
LPHRKRWRIVPYGTEVFEKCQLGFDFVMIVNALANPTKKFCNNRFVTKPYFFSK